MWSHSSWNNLAPPLFASQSNNSYKKQQVWDWEYLCYYCCILSILVHRVTSDAISLVRVCHFLFVTLIYKQCNTLTKCIWYYVPNCLTLSRLWWSVMVCRDYDTDWKAVIRNSVGVKIVSRLERVVPHSPAMKRVPAAISMAFDRYSERHHCADYKAWPVLIFVVQPNKTNTLDQCLLQFASLDEHCIGWQRVTMRWCWTKTRDGSDLTMHAGGGALPAWMV